MRNKTNGALLAGTAILLMLIFPQALLAKKVVARIVVGYQGCKVLRNENGMKKKYNAEAGMNLYAGDILDKPGDIKSIKLLILPYWETKKINENRLIIVCNPPQKKEEVSKKTNDFQKKAQKLFREIPLVSRGEIEGGASTLENATLIADQKIYFSEKLKGKTILFRAPGGKEVFRKTFGDDLYLTPGKIGLAQGETYILEIWRWENLHYRTLIRLLAKNDEVVVKKALEKIDSEGISADQKIVKKAAYLQFLSDLYPLQIDLYWLSYHILKNADLHKDNIIDLHDVLTARCFDHFVSRGLSEQDFAVLDSPGCLVTVELEREGVKRFVAPDFFFQKYDTFSLHFQSNFKGYAIVLHQTKDRIDLAFPNKHSAYKIEPKWDYRSCSYRLGSKRSTENYLFILSKNPIEELGQFKKLTVNEWKCSGEFTPGQHKILEKLCQRAKKQGQKIELEMLGTKSFAKLSGKSFTDVVWFMVLLENYGE